MDMGNLEDCDYYIKICIVITMYNEGVEEFQDTMKGVITGIQELQEKMDLEPQDICIFLIADGFKQVRESDGFLEFMEECGLYDENLIPDEYFNRIRRMMAQSPSNVWISSTGIQMELIQIIHSIMLFISSNLKHALILILKSLLEI